jgi:hypothetical protein
MPKLDI